MSLSHRRYATIAGFVAFVFGVAINLTLSSMILWGELEAGALINQIGDSSLGMHCPILLAPGETGLIKTSVTNTLSEKVSPTISTQVNDADEFRSSGEIMELAPHQTVAIERPVDTQQLLFNRIRIISILQGRYGDLVSRQGTCSIVVVNILGMTGRGALSIMLITSLLLNAGGVGVLLHLHSPLSEYKRNLAQACGMLLISSTLGLIFTFTNAWGLALIFSPLAGLTILIILTEVIFLPKN